MNIAQDINDHLYQIHSFTSKGVEIAVPSGNIDVELRPIDGLIPLSENFIISPRHLKTDWKREGRAALNEEDFIDLANILEELTVEILILGTGERILFPEPSELSPFLSRGIGVEAMDSRAACRTYNLLAAEGRAVAAAITL